jgi:molybdate transport repressor ModE-like protein
MELRQLTSLVAIADHGSFSAAARSLGTVQSNVSAHISRLEKDLGTTLVDRLSGSLTSEGETVVERARRILHELDDIESDIKSRDDNVSGDTRIGVLGTTARWLMPRFLTVLNSSFPEIRAVVHEGSTSSLVPRLHNGSIDAAIVHLPLEDPEIHTEVLFAEELILIAHTKHELASASTITLAELAHHPLLLPPRSTAFRRIVDRAAANKGVALHAQAEIDGVRLLASLVFEGFGAAIVPASAVPGWLKGDFTRIAVPELPQRVVGWAQRHRPPPNRATRASLDVALDVVHRYGPRQPGVHVGKGAFPFARAADRRA